MMRRQWSRAEWKFGKIQMLQKVRDKVLDIKGKKFQLHWSWYSDRHWQDCL